MRRMRLLFLAAVAAIAVTAATTARAQETPLSGVLASDLQKADILSKAGDWQALEVHARDWSAREGANWESWYYWGLALSSLEQNQKAMNAYVTASKLLPQKNDGLLLAIADLQAKLGVWDKAEESYRDVLLRQSANVNIWSKLLAVVQAQTGEEKREQESRIYGKIMYFAAYVNSYDHWRAYAELLDSLNAANDAREAYRHVLRLRPTDLAAAEWVYRYEREAGDSESLKKIYEHLLQLNPKHPLVNLYLAEAALKNGKKTKAKRYFEDAAEGQEYPRARAIALAYLGDLASERNHQRALELYLAAINSDPSHLHGWEGAVVMFRLRGEQTKARQYFSRMRVVERLNKEGKPITRALLAFEQ